MFSGNPTDFQFRYRIVLDGNYPRRIGECRKYHYIIWSERVVQSLNLYVYCRMLSKHFSGSPRTQLKNQFHYRMVLDDNYPRRIGECRKYHYIIWSERVVQSLNLYVYCRLLSVHFSGSPRTQLKNQFIIA